MSELEVKQLISEMLLNNLSTYISVYLDRSKSDQIVLRVANKISWAGIVISEDYTAISPDEVRRLLNE